MRPCEDAKKPTLEVAARELEEATKEYDAARDRARQASHEETDALNRVNRAQAAFDGACQRVRDGAPNGTDWWSRPSGAPRVEGVGA